MSRPICQACPTCGRGSYLDHELPPNLFGQKWYACQFCGLYFTGEPAPDVLVAHYASKANVGNRRNWFRHQCAKVRAKSQKRYIEKHTGLHGGLMVDIGHGGGELLREFEWDDWYIYGIEYVHCIPKLNCSLVTMSHVLEHTCDPESTLSSIKNGIDYIFIEVPDADKLPRTSDELQWPVAWSHAHEGRLRGR